MASFSKIPKNWSWMAVNPVTIASVFVGSLVAKTVAWSKLSRIGSNSLTNDSTANLRLVSFSCCSRRLKFSLSAWMRLLDFESTWEDARSQQLLEHLLPRWWCFADFLAQARPHWGCHYGCGGDFAQSCTGRRLHFHWGLIGDKDFVDSNSGSIDLCRPLFQPALWHSLSNWSDETVAATTFSFHFDVEEHLLKQRNEHHQ